MGGIFWKRFKFIAKRPARSLSLLILTGFILSGCGYPTPLNGGGLTPFITVVTPTPLPATATAYADATVLARNTPTPLPLTFAANQNPSPTATQPIRAALPTSTPTPGFTGDEYTIQSGDTLLGIAIKFNVDFEELASLNNIADRNNIKVGQKLKLPRRKVGTPGAPLSPSPLG